MSNNPLSNFFRIPGLSITLPTKGAYNNFETTLTGEIETYPFSTEDELYLSNPDSLLSGSALEHLVRSCVPSFKDNPRDLIMEDINAILLAAKYSTYGDELEMEITCPECGEVFKVSFSIKEILLNIKYFPDETVVETNNGLKIYIKPLDLKSYVKLQLEEIKNISLVQKILNQDIPEEERLKLLSPSVVSMVNNSIDTISMGIEKIIANNGELVVTNPVHIKSFIENTTSSLTKMIRKKQEDLLTYGIQKSVDVTCNKCHHEWKSKLDVDPTSFFAQNS